MDKVMIFLATAVAGIATAVASENPLILKSGFEDAEHCVVLNGLKAQIPMQTVSVSGDFLLNGGDFPAVAFDYAEFFLRDRETGVAFSIGESRDGNYDVKVLPGRYDVVYSFENATQIVPRNEDTVLLEDVAIYGDQELDIDVTSYVISGDVTLGGGAFSQTDFDDGTIYLVDERGGRVTLADTRDQSFTDQRVIAGVYGVFYEVESLGDSTPANRWAQIGQMTVDANSADQDIDVPVFNLTGDFTLNDGPFVNSDFDDGNFYLENGDGDRALLGSSKDQAYSINVVPGTYDVYWEVETVGDTVPVNARARLLKSVAVGASSLDIDVTTHELSGDYRLNGQAFPNSELNLGRMLLKEVKSGEFTELGRTKDQSYERQVIAGVYDVIYQHLDGAEVPQNKGYVVSSEEILDQDRVLDLDVPSGTYSGSIFQNGALFPANADQAGIVIFQDPSGDDFVLLGLTSVQSYSVLVAPGVYDAYYSWLQGVQVPRNRKALIAEGVEVLSPDVPDQTSEDLQVTSYSYPGAFLLNGESPPGVAFDKGEVFLRLGDDEVVLGETADEGFSVRVVYDPARSQFPVHYEALNRGDQVPYNENSIIGCVKLKPPVL